MATQLRSPDPSFVLITEQTPRPIWRGVALMEIAVPADCRILICLLCLALAACDNTPNAGFQQAIKDRDAAQAGDAYASLESSMPRVSNYSRQKPEQQRDYAEGQSGTFRATYDSLLTQLDADKSVDHAKPPFKRCRQAFAQASDAQSGKASVAEAVTALEACRDAARSAKAAGSAGEAAALLSRFASTGVAMLGAKLVGQGETGAGLKVWGDGETFASQDKPGFKLGLKSLRGY